MGKSKVLMIGPDRSVHGGISGVVNNYYEAGIEEQIELMYLGTMVEGSKLRKLIRAIVAYIKFCRLLPGYSIVHVNMASDSSYYRKSFFIRKAKKAHKRIIIHQHGGDFETFYRKQKSDVKRAKIKEVLNMADVFLVLSPILETFFKKLIIPSKIVLFPNAIAVGAPFEKEYGKQRMLFLGRICKEKGIGELFQILPELHEKYPKMKLFLGGVWEDEELQKQAEKLSEYVIYLGWLGEENKRQYLALSDIFVFPTYFEGQPVSVLEAMASYCAVAASDTGGIPQMVQHEKSGLLFEPKDADALKNTLECLLEDVQLCRYLGMNARKIVEEKFAMKDSLKRLVEIYHENEC